MATTPEYLDDNAAGLVRLIKDGAIFLRDVGATAPTGTAWEPGATDKMLGYYSSDGFTLAPVPGDATDFEAHNGDVVFSDTKPGWWTLKVSSLEGREAANAAYFDLSESDIGEDGSITVDKASNLKEYDMVVVGLDQKDRVILAHLPMVKISEKEGITFNRSTLLALGMTWRTYKGSAATPYHFKAWGFINEG